MTKRDPQTYWKRIKVPAELLAAGWVLEKRDSTAPFAMVNEKLDQETGGFPDPQEAITAAGALMIESAERAAILAEGANGNGHQDQEEPFGVAGPGLSYSLPLKLIDEGWHLVSKGDPKQYRAHLGELTTDLHLELAVAVAEAIKLEDKRQADLEALERAGGGALVQFVESGQAAQNAVNEIIGHQDQAPAEMMLETKRIRTDGGTQQRLNFDEAVVADYAEALNFEGADHFPAVDVFFDGAEYWLADGFYRLRAHEAIGQKQISAHVRQGSQRDALLFSLGANARHGQPRTPDDKRRAVLVMLRDQEWQTWSDGYIADRVRVSVPFVRKLRRQETPETPAADNAGGTPPKPRRGRDGRIQDTSNIGTRTKREKPASLPLEVAETGHPKKTENAKPPLPAVVHKCADCAREISAGDYQNELGQCWDCARGEDKHPRGKKPGADLAPARPTVAEVCQDRLFVSFTWTRRHPKTVSINVAVDLRAPQTIVLPSIVVWPFLPDRVIALIQRQHKARPAPTTTITTRTSTKKRTTKAAPKLERKPTAKASKPKEVKLARRTKPTPARKPNPKPAKPTSKKRPAKKR